MRPFLLLSAHPSKVESLPELRFALFLLDWKPASSSEAPVSASRSWGLQARTEHLVGYVAAEIQTPILMVAYQAPLTTEQSLQLWKVLF